MSRKMGMVLTSGYQIAAPTNEAVKRTSGSGTSVPMTLVASSTTRLRQLWIYMSLHNRNRAVAVINSSPMTIIKLI